MLSCIAALTSLCPIVFITAARFPALFSTRVRNRDGYNTGPDPQEGRPSHALCETALRHPSSDRTSIGWMETAILRFSRIWVDKTVHLACRFLVLIKTCVETAGSSACATTARCLHLPPGQSWADAVAAPRLRKKGGAFAGFQRHCRRFFDPAKRPDASSAAVGSGFSSRCGNL